MQKSRNKTLAIMIAILLTVSMAASLSQIPNASAHNPPQALTTNAYITALPSPIGLGQTTLIYMWLNRVYGYYPVGEPAGSINYAAVNNNYRFHNYKLTITDPNGENTTKTFDTIQDTTSSQAYSFTPTIVGTYTLTFDFPGQTITTTNGSPISVAVNDTYLPSTATTTLTVQQDPIANLSRKLSTSTLNTGLAQFTERTHSGGQYRLTGLEPVNHRLMVES